MKPLLFLEYRQFINAVKNTTRSPKRLIPALLIGAWLMSAMLSNILMFSGARPGFNPVGEAGARIGAIPVDTIQAGVFLFLSLGSVLVIYQAFSSGLLIFSVSHIDFMFPTPISRRKVLLVKLIKDYAKYGFWVAVLFVLIGSPMLAALSVPLFPAALLSIGGLVPLLLFVVNIAHTINIIFTFSYERLKQAGFAIKAVLIAAAASAVGAGVYQYVQTGSTYASVLWAANSPVVNTVFAPARWCTTLVLAPILGATSEDFVNLGLLWLLAGGSFLLLLSRRENVYEPSIGISVKHARRRQAIRSGDYTLARIEAIRERGARKSSGLSIPPFGQGAVAILWKNMVVKYRMSSTPVVVLLVLPLGLLLVRHFVKTPIMLRVLPVTLVYIVYVLAIVAAAEVRAEMKYANILKSMPIAAWKVMLAEAVNGAIYLGSGIAVFAACMWAVIPQTRGPLLIVCGVSAPFVGFASLGAAMIPSLLYPDTRDAAQNYIYNLVGFLLVTIAMVPTIVLGGVLYWAVDAPTYVTLLVICSANVIVGAAGVSLAGSLFRKFDPTGE